MQVHARARLTPKGKALVIERVLREGWSARVAAEAAGVAERTVYRWLARYRAEGETGLLDRSSAPRSIPHRTPRERVAAILALRRLRMTSTEIAELLDMPLSTVSVVLRREGLGKLSRLEPPEPPNRYERRAPGELIHIDVKKLGRILKPGHRVTGNRRGQAKTRRDGKPIGLAGWEFVHIAIDDHSRLAYAEVLANERGETAVGFLRRAVAFFASHRIIGAAGDDRQRLALRLGRAREGLQGAGPAPSAHPALPAPNEWKGRALHPDDASRVGLWTGLRDQRGSNGGAAFVA